MKTRSSFLRSAAALLILAGAGLTISSSARGGERNDVVAVYASVSPAYTRTRLPDGSFKTESYAFGEGGRLTGMQRDGTIDGLRFIDIAHVIAPSLASKNYVPCDTSDPRHADLLIMVYWGTTVGTDDASSSPEYQIAQSLIPPPMAPQSPAPTGQGGTEMVSDPSTSGRGTEGQMAAAIENANNSALDQSLALTAMANRQRDRQNIENASIIGYLPAMKEVSGSRMTPLDMRRRDLLQEIEESRYYVVLLAYDFQTILQHKQRKLLWETRFSIPQRHNDFSKQLAAMTQTAASYFGQDSNGLTHKPVREGRVILGEPKVIGYESEEK